MSIASWTPNRIVNFFEEKTLVCCLSRQQYTVVESGLRLSKPGETELGHLEIAGQVSAEREALLVLKEQTSDYYYQGRNVGAVLQSSTP